MSYLHLDGVVDCLFHMTCLEMWVQANRKHFEIGYAEHVLREHDARISR